MQVELRYPILLKLIKYCTAANLLDSVLGSPEKRSARIEQWIRDWELDEVRWLAFAARASEVPAEWPGSSGSKLRLRCSRSMLSPRSCGAKSCSSDKELCKSLEAKRSLVA